MGPENHYPFGDCSLESEAQQSKAKLLSRCWDAEAVISHLVYNAHRFTAPWQQRAYYQSGHLTLAASPAIEHKESTREWGDAGVIF